MSVYNLSQYLSLLLFYSFFLFDVCFYFCKRVRLTYVLNSDLTWLDLTWHRCLQNIRLRFTSWTAVVESRILSVCAIYDQRVNTIWLYYVTGKKIKDSTKTKGFWRTFGGINIRMQHIAYVYHLQITCFSVESQKQLTRSINCIYCSLCLSFIVVSMDLESEINAFIHSFIH